MKKKHKIIWFIIKYGLEKLFLKNFEIYSPSVAGSSKIKGKITKGEVAEWFKAHAWKVCKGAILSWVRIPFSPPFNYR